jgi:hypothetical protein
VEILADSAQVGCGLVACIWIVLVDVLHDSDGCNNFRDNLRQTDFYAKVGRLRGIFKASALHPALNPRVADNHLKSFSNRTTSN